MLLRTTGLCSARFCFFAIAKPHSFLRSLLAFGSSPVTRIYLARVKIKIADNRILPFPVDGSPSARFRKRNVTELVLRLAMRTTGLCSARFYFSTCLFFTKNLTHSCFTLLAIADGVANSRFIGCLVALFFLQVLPPATMQLPTRSSSVFRFRFLVVRTTGLCSARFYFSTCLFFTKNLTHSCFTLLAIADGVANSRFIGCLVALFFLKVLPSATMRLPTRSSPFNIS